jgi:hypothetical protein
MTNPRTKRLLGLLGALAATLVFAVGCGGDDNDGGGNGGGGDKPSIGGGNIDGGGSDETPDNKDEAVEQCYEEAKKLEGQARETYEAGCKAADTGDTDALRDEAREQCLENAKQIPDKAAREQTEETCENLGE